MSNYANKIRVPKPAYEYFQAQAMLNSYPYRQLSRFLNDVLLADINPNPENLKYRITEPLGINYRVTLTQTALDAADEVAMYSGLPKGDPSYIFNNLYSNYLVLDPYPNAYQVLIDHGIDPASLTDTSTAAQNIADSLRRPEYSRNDPIDRPFKSTVGMTLTDNAADNYDQQRIDNLIYATIIDTRPDDILMKHKQMEIMGLPIRWTIPNQSSMLVNVRVSVDTISYLAQVARSHKIHGAKQNTDNALAAAVVNALAEGWLTVVTE